LKVHKSLYDLREEIAVEIDKHNISFRTAHSRTEKHTVEETFVFATRNGRSRLERTTDDQGNTDVSRQTHIQPDRVEVSEEGKKASESKESEESDEFELTAKQRMELELIYAAFQQIDEGNFEFLDPEEFLEKMEKAKDGELGSKDGKQSSAPEESNRGQGTDRGEGANFGFSYNYEETHYESEKLTFGAEGSIQTADGEKISFDMDMNISREFFEKTSVSIQGGNAKLIDPLVVNFDGKAAELSETTFSFDINADGAKESISKLKPGSGFLALDKNGNGEIDDGSELFGPRTGKGFEELAEYDGDRNRFIDEGDEVFDDLMLMTANHSGEQSLISLEEAGVGAIFLGSADTEFSYKTGTDNTLQGQLDRSGVFIGEDGSVGSVQKINMADQSEAGETRSVDEPTADSEDEEVEGSSDERGRGRPGTVPGTAVGRPTIQPGFSTANLPDPTTSMPMNGALQRMAAGGLTGINQFA
jgi:hypothetical protein